MAFGRRGGWFMDRGNPLSVLEIVKTGTLDLRLASLLWVIMERRASVIVAAIPSQGGKSTTLNVLLDFMRPDVKRIELEADDEFSFLPKAKPADSYLVAAEFSDYGMYIWGETAVKAFDLLSKGYGLGGTMHAETDEEVVGILNQYLGLSWETLGHVDVIVTIFVARAGRSYDAPIIRRINSVSLLIPRKNGLSLATLARLGPSGNDFDIGGVEELQMALSSRLNIKSDVGKEMAEKEQFLRRLVDEGKTSRDDVCKAIVEFYKSHPA